ncbi:MAG: hypothetical protein J4G04_08695 [Nitrosopumilaceae archaeon]|nr:hypothetical protein [Nitrosopumilaceae archaeon]
MVETSADMVRRHPSPRPHANRGRPPIHSKEKMDFACVLMVARNVSSRDMSELRTLKNPWDAEPIPDHTTIWSHFDTLDEEWLQYMLTRWRRACMDAAGWTSGSAGSDSSGVGGQV